MKNDIKLMGLSFGAAIIGGAWFCAWQNNDIVITKTNYVSKKIPCDFDNFVIAHISDLHDKVFGKNQRRLLNKLRSVAPNIIVITGDLIDKRRYDEDMAAAMSFVRGALSIAPVYFVTGNHEAWEGRYAAIKARLTDAGVFVMDDTKLEISKGKSVVSIFGISDPNIWRLGRVLNKGDINAMRNRLSEWRDDGGFKILLSHRPEYFGLYCRNNMDLIFAGHAHGGQLRLPFIGGIIAPGQGFFPKYTCGCYTKNSSAMLVSRGLGSSVVPLRVLNRPEIVAVTLKLPQA